MKTFNLNALLTCGLAYVDAVSLHNHQHMHCAGAVQSCTTISHATCCARHGAHGFSSTDATGVDDYTLVQVFSPHVVSNPHPGTILQYCGRVRGEAFGNDCANMPTVNGGRGSWWLHCISVCATEVESRTNKKETRDTESLAVDREAWAANQTCTGSVLPDKLTFSDGHMFEIGETTPAHYVAMLEDFADADVGIEALPEELLQYEVNPEGVRHRLEWLRDRTSHDSLTPNLGY